MINSVVCECCMTVYPYAETRCPHCKGITPPEFKVKTKLSIRWLRASLVKTLGDTNGKIYTDIDEDEGLLLNQKCGVIRRKIRTLDRQLTTLKNRTENR